MTTQAIRQILKRSFPRLALYRRVIRTLVEDENSYLHETGWLRSLAEQRPMDKQGRPLPWMNYPVVRFLDERLKPDVELFEFGSGWSTAFYAERVRQVTSVEYDAAWYEQIGKTLPANAALVFQPQDVDGAYCRTIAATGRSYDVVVVDGRDRVNCLRQAVDCLTARGVVLLDDSQRERYASGIEHLKWLGFSALSFEGLKPTGAEIDRTTIFYRPGNALGL